MTKTYEERILDFLWSVAPNEATNSEIGERTGIRSHQQIYLLTQKLVRKGRLRGEQRGREWFFWADESEAAQLASPGSAHPKTVLAEHEETLGSAGFEALAQRVMSAHYGVPLAAGEVPGVPKRFDLVSPARNIVGDAKYFALVRGQHLPPAKFSVIAEDVWLLEKTGAPVTFMVFGNDRQVPELWLARYGALSRSVDLFFLSDQGVLERLTR